MLVLRFLLMTYDLINGDDFFTTTNLSSVGDTISLQCRHRQEYRSRLELAKACSSEATCHAIRTEERGTSSLWCACPTDISWPRSMSYALSIIHLRHLVEPLPGINSRENNMIPFTHHSLRLRYLVESLAGIIIQVKLMGIHFVDHMQFTVTLPRYIEFLFFIFLFPIYLYRVKHSATGCSTMLPCVQT